MDDCCTIGNKIIARGIKRHHAASSSSVANSRIERRLRARWGTGMLNG